MATGAPPPSPGPAAPAPGPAARVVAAVIGEGALTFDLAVPCEVFGLDRSDLGVAWYRFLLVSADPSPITTSTGFQLATPHRLDALAEAGTVVVPGWCDPEVRPTAELVAALTAAHRAGAGSCRCAPAPSCWPSRAAGRAAGHHPLDVRRAPAGPLRRPGRPGRPVRPGRQRVHLGRHRRRHRPLPAPGAPGPRGRDRQRRGRRLVMPPFREGGQAQYIDRPLPVDPADQAFGDLLRWAADHLDEGVTVDDLARRAAMSTRTLGRRFRGALGLSPSEWLLGERIRLAQRILETHLRSSPRAYRRTFRAATPAGRSPEP